MSQFIWNVKCVTRTHWVSWSSICGSISKGGLRFRSIEQINDGLQAKLLWLVLTGGSLCFRFMRAKYFKDDQIFIPAGSSPLWRELVQKQDWESYLVGWLDRVNGDFGSITGLGRYCMARDQ